MLLLLLSFATSLQQVQTGFLDRSVTVGGKAYRYEVYVPADYASKPNWPAILFLHGAGERGTDGLLQTNVGLGAAIRQNAARYPAIVVFPQVPPDSQWVGTPADMAVAALQQTMRELHVDPSRVYLTGLSMGGHGTWYVAYRHPELFAAIVPICGWVRDFPMFRGSVPVVPGDSASVMPNLAQHLGKIPIWIFHGEVDQVVNVNGSREPAAALKAAGANVQYTELLGLNHNSWDAAYGSDEFVRWLFAQQRR
ncbi:MAG TPA: alpha/beta hydrolase-fold protein [Gemmatimonadales bacterium]|nr:alpha/beta hydrolase-fold protein [Gemmatimonadales bacterium]